MQQNSMTNNHFDIVVIGSGPGGYIAGLKAAQMGARTMVIENHHLGGTCLNYGCIPSKALLSSAELLHTMQHASNWGIAVNGSIECDWQQVIGHKDKIIRQLRSGVAALFKGRKVELGSGRGSFEAPGRVVVTPEDGAPRVVTADKVIIATGSVPSRIPGWPDDPALVCTSDEGVHWTSLPKRLLIVGGGVIGCEFACMMQAFGVEVTVVEMLPSLIPTMDQDLGIAQNRGDRGDVARNHPGSAFQRPIAPVRPGAGRDGPSSQHQRTGTGPRRYPSRQPRFCPRERSVGDQP